MRNYKKISITLLLFLFSPNDIYCLKLDRVIFATDTNPDYIQFWPFVARAWKEILGVRPTLALIAGPETSIDQSQGDVIRFDPIPNIPTSMQAQTIRLLLPSLFENDVCILSDIDLFPLQKKYFIKPINEAPDNTFVVYRDKAYGDNVPHFPMCYVAAKGGVFKEIFGGGSIESITTRIIEWSNLKYGWHTDERVLTQYSTAWGKATSRLIKLGHRVESRVDREGMYFDYKQLAKGLYIDCHAPRPYSKYKEWIDNLLVIQGTSNTQTQGASLKIKKKKKKERRKKKKK